MNLIYSVLQKTKNKSLNALKWNKHMLVSMHVVTILSGVVWILHIWMELACVRACVRATVPLHPLWLDNMLLLLIKPLWLSTNLEHHYHNMRFHLISYAWWSRYENMPDRKKKRQRQKTGEREREVIVDVTMLHLKHLKMERVRKMDCPNLNEHCSFWNERGLFSQPEVNLPPQSFPPNSQGHCYFCPSVHRQQILTCKSSAPLSELYPQLPCCEPDRCIYI